MTNWAGPQWVLATLFAMAWGVRVAFTPNRWRTGDWPNRAAFAWSELVRWSDDFVMLAILWWGGFWS